MGQLELKDARSACVDANNKWRRCGKLARYRSSRQVRGPDLSNLLVRTHIGGVLQVPATLSLIKKLERHFHELGGVVPVQEDSCKCSLVLVDACGV